MEQATFLLDNSFLEKINNESTTQSQSVKNYEEFNKQIEESSKKYDGFS